MTNWLWSSVEKMKRLMVPVERRLFCVVCKVPRPEADSINRSGYVPEDPSVHADVLVVDRVHGSLKDWGYACIFLKDFEKLKMMYDVDWNEMQRIIYRHKRKNAYALLYLGDLPCAAENAMMNNFERKISELVDICYQSFSGNTGVEILTIEGTKINGRHLSCDFVDVHHAELILSNYKRSHGAGGNTRVEPHPDEV